MDDEPHGEESSDDDFEWDLEMELLCLPASGGSVRQMQRLAARIAKGCGQVPAHVVQLGNLSADSHRERDMHRWATRQAWRKLLPAPFEVDLPFTANQIDESVATHAMLLPHEAFARIAEHPDLCQVLFTGAPGTLEDFWNKSAGCEWFERHPLHDEICRNPTLFVPFGIHGDDGGVYGSSNSVMVLTWGSVVQELVTLDSRILFTGVLLNTAVPGKTLDAMYKVFVWSLNCLAAGFYPEADHMGKEFSPEYEPTRYKLRGQRLNQAGLRCVFSELRGDWKWQGEALHLDQKYDTNFVCHLCRASTKIKRLWYTNFEKTAHIRNTRVRWSTFRDWYTDRYMRPEFFNIIGFTIWRCWSDAMHVLDLGVYQSIAASCLAELVEEGVWTHTGEDGYKVAHIAYKEWCVLRGLPPAPRFEKGRLFKTRTDFPKFTQQSAKASATRYIMRWLHYVLQRVDHAGSSMHSKRRLEMMAAFVDFEDTCERYGRFLPRAAAESLASSMERALLLASVLAAEASANDKFLWHIIPKFHMATHLAYDFAVDNLVNPRRTTCYADEDMVGRCKKIVQRCHGKTAGRSLVLRYAILVCTRWWTKMRGLRGLRQAEA